MSDAQPHRAYPWSDWLTAARREGVHAALVDLYDRLEAEIAARGPTCWLSGRCCHFNAHGHRLYVTGLEIAWVWGQLDAGRREAVRQVAASGDLPTLDGCPLQVNGLCGVHGIRPLGCRIYFCDPTAQDWQNPVYERFLAELRTLHDRLGLPYAYMEWRAGLGELAEATMDVGAG